MTRRWSVVAGALAASALLAFVVHTQPEWLRRVRVADPDPRWAALVAAVGEQRYVEARVTGGFRFGPLHTTARTAQDLAQQNLALLAAAGEVQKRAHADPSADNLGVLGAALLHLGDIDGAIANLERAAATATSAAVLSNLGAAYLARAEASKRDADMSLALESVEASLAVAPALPEALFNRALLLEKFKLHTSAVRAWDAFLTSDAASAWADEGRRRRAALLDDRRGPSVDEAVDIVLRQPDRACELVARDSLLMREAAEDILLPAWGDHVLRGTDDAAHLAAATTVGRCLAAQTPGALTADAVTAIHRADAAGRLDLARAHQLWRTGRAAYAKAAPDDFGPAFAEAQQLFERRQSPLRLWAQQYAVAALFYRGRLVEAIHEVEALEAEPAVVRGGSLWARLQWIRGSIHFQQAAFGASLVAYRRALHAFEELREGEHVVAMHQSLAEAYGRLGLEREAWEAHRQALQALDLARDYRRIHSALTSPGYTAQLAGLHASALVFFTEGHYRAVAAGHVNYQFECEVGMGRALMALGRFDAASDVYTSALALSGMVTNPSLRARHTADVYAGLSEIAAARHDYGASLKWIDEALAGLGAVSSEYLVAMLHLRKGRTLDQLGRVEDARAAFGAGIDILESKRAQLQQIAQRVSYTDRAWDLYGDIIGLIAVDQRNPDEALHWVDRSRARSLQDSRPNAQVPSHRTTTVAVPPGAAILVLAQTRKGLLLWLRSGEDTAFHVVERPDAVRRLIAAGNHPSPALLAAAFDEIVRPFSGHLGAVDTVTVVPDWTTQAIPFAALRDGSRPWIDGVTISIAPSVSLALASAERRDPPPPASIAVVTADAEAAPATDALPGAAHEARTVRQFYRDAIVLEGRNATLQSLRDAMRRVDVMHVAMHARADGRYLDRFTIDIRDEVTGLPLSAESMLGDGRAPRLVVLAACQTANGPTVRGEILMSLARPFMLAGTRYVIATLWDVPDRETNDLMVDFHAALAAGIAPASALARAQRRAAAGRADHPWWAAFVLVAVG